MSIKPGVIKSCIITLMVLVLVLSLNVNVSAVNVGTGTNVPIYYDMPAFVWTCNNSIIINNSQILRSNDSFYEGDQISLKTLVMYMNGINKIQNVFLAIGLVNGTGNNIQINCIPDVKSNTAGLIDSSCNAKILEETITAFYTPTMGYYICNLTVGNSKSMKGEYWLNIEADDINGLASTMEGNKYLTLNPKITYPNTEVIIKYNPTTKNLSVTGNSTNTTIKKIVKCLDRNCASMYENYLFTNEFGNQINLKVSHMKIQNQDHFNLISIQYNNDKPINIFNKYLLKDNKNQITTQFSNKTSTVSALYDKIKDKTTIKIAENRKMNKSIMDGDYLIVVQTNNGTLNYNLLRFDSNNNNNNTLFSSKIDEDSKNYIQNYSGNIHLLISFINFTNVYSTGLEPYGAKICSYIPYNKWIVSIPSNKINSIITLSNIQNISVIFPKDKIKVYFLNDINNIVNKDGYVPVNIVFYNDVNHNQSLNVLYKYNGKLDNTGIRVNTAMSADLPKENVTKILNEDIVQFIEPKLNPVIS